MSIRNFFKSLTPNCPSVRRRGEAPRLGVEALEDRWVPSFGIPTDYGAGLAPQIMVSADFDGDGKLDLATANTNSLSVLLGNGNGTFQPPLTTPADYYPRSMRASDLNADGKTDLVTVSASFGLEVRLGNGNGTFQPPAGHGLLAQLTSYFGEYPAVVAQYPESVVVGDLDADGREDLIVGGVTAYTVYLGGEWVDTVYESFANVLLGNGDGTFDFGVVKPAGGAYDLESGDFNNDGWLDIVANDGVLLGNGDGTLRDSINAGVATYLTSNPVNDLNSDGNLDVLSGGYLSLGNGDGTFQPSSYLDPNALSYSAVGDVNADGNLDVVLMTNAVTHFGVEDYISDSITARSVRVLLGNGNGTFARPISVNFGTISGISSFTAAVLADFNGDGKPDLATSESFAPDVYSSPASRGLYVALNDGAWVAPPPPMPSMTIDDVTLTEGNTGTRSASFTVTLSAASTQAVRVAYSTANGTATAGSDYQATTGTLIFAPGQTTKTFTVLINGDRVGEANETFVVNLSSPTNATVADGQGVGTIADDEPRISIGDVTRAEGGRGQSTFFSFTVTLSAAYDQPVTMSFRTANGTAKTSDGDYVAKTGTLTFAPGETTKTITVEVKGDSKREGNENFYLDLFGNSGNSLFTKSRGLGTILNDD